MATNDYKLAALETSYGSLHVLEPFGFDYKHTIKSNSKCTGIKLGPSQTYLALISGIYLTDLGESPASLGL